MSTVIVLGGAGAVGSVAAEKLADSEEFERVVIGDVNLEKAREIEKRIGSPKISVMQVDAGSPDSIKTAVAGSDLVLNCVGPFYRTVKTILQVVIDSGINYVDICDDVDVTLEILELDREAREKGVCALIGMGSSPGATNVLAKLAADSLLDETDSIDIFHAHGGEPVEGEGVIAHRFHCMSIDIPMFLEGKLQYVKFFEKEGLSLQQTFNFPVLGDNIQLYPYPHPEQVTLPRTINVQQVTNKGTVLPAAYYDLTKEMCRLGLAGREPVTVMGREIRPYDFSIAYILKERERILQETDFGSQRGCCSVVVKGKKEGKYDEYRFHMASGNQALGEGTGIPAAIGAILMQQGKIARKGVYPPEACVDPNDFIQLVSQVMKLDKKQKDDESFGGVIVQRLDESGTVTTLDI